MQRRMLALLLLLASTGMACGRDPYGGESGGVSQGIPSSITGPGDVPRSPMPPPDPPPSGGFGPVQITPERERRADVVSTGGSDGATRNCWDSPVLSEYTLSRKGGKPASVAAAKDGSVWFSDPATTSVGRLEPSGAVTRYRLPAGRAPGSLVAARDPTRRRSPSPNSPSRRVRPVSVRRAWSPGPTVLCGSTAAVRRSAG